MALSRWQKAVLAALVTAGVLAGVEGTLRLTLPVVRKASMPPDMVEAHLVGEAFRYDPDLGWYWKHLSTQGAATNAFGFRRHLPMSFDKPEGVVRVVSLGDSQTFGAGLRPDESYSALAEAELGEGWEVLNAGISGYRSLNVLRLLKLRIHAFAPDAIVVDCMPFDSPRDDGTIQGRALAETWTDRVKRTLWNLRLYYVLRLALEKSDGDRPRWLDQAANRRGGPSREYGNHDLIQQWGDAEGVTVFFLQYPVMNESGALGCMTNPGELPPGVRVIPACDAILADGRPGPTLFQDRNHLTLEGARVVGRAVAEALRAWKAGG